MQLLRSLLASSLLLGISTATSGDPSEGSGPAPAPPPRAAAAARPGPLVGGPLPARDADPSAAEGHPPAATAEEAAPDALGRIRPHPITPERERMVAQQRHFAAVEAAIAANDFASARELLDAHPAAFPGKEGWTDHREGYLRVIECREHPGPTARASARVFLDTERASPLRRRVRRACLSP